MERDIPFAGFKLDLCEKHWAEYQEAIKLATSIFRGEKTGNATEEQWDSWRKRLVASA